LHPGCDGSQECASDCEYDALHVVRGMLEPQPYAGISSDDYGEPCHEWALSQPGYLGTYCGSLEYLTGGKSIVIADMAQGEALSLVFCSDTAVQPGRGFAVSVSAVPCPHNCSGHGTCTGHSRAFVSEPVCVCAPGWAGSFCNDKSMVCDPKVPLNSSALGSGSYMCVEVREQTMSPDLASWLGRTKDAVLGLLVCAPGFSGQDCTVPSCGGEVNITWTTAEIASHDANRSSKYPDGASCRWLYQVAAAAPGAKVTVNVSLLDLEFQRDILEITCVGTDGASLDPSTAMVGRFTGNAPCPAWPACMDGREGVQEQAGADTCSHGVGDEASSGQPSSAGYCLLQREWRWVAVQVHQSDCPVLSVRFTSDSSKSGAGFTAQIFPTNSQLMRPFVEATITFFNHSIADLHNKTQAVLSAVALAAQVPQRDVLLTHVVGHMNSGGWRAGEQDPHKVPGKRDGRRPVDSEGRQAHEHVTVTIKVLAHQTDAPEPTAWALYHRLALAEPLTGKYNNSNSNRRPHRSLWNSTRVGRHSINSNWAGAGKGRVESGEDRAWGRRSPVDDTLWVWALDGQWAASGIWKDSEGDGTAIIEVRELSRCVVNLPS
jgi:hypothetical protein